MARGVKTGGRQKGSQNKLTKNAKEAFQLAFDSLGGWQGLARWAKSDPDNTKVFYSLYSKLIPTDITSGGQAMIPAPQIIAPGVIDKAER